ncbi:MAG TPA: ABC-2 transporter permease, partial [Clostridia bacterium]
KDIFFTVSLPVKKRDMVKARFAFIAIIELVQILVAIPFAIIGAQINPNPLGNPVGIEANVAFFGFVFIMYALYNGVFLPLFYKTAYRAGFSLLLASLAVTVYIVVIEAAIQIIPALKTWLDTTDPGQMIRQVPILAAGIAIYILSMLLAYRKSARNFEKVDL